MTSLYSLPQLTAARVIGRLVAFVLVPTLLVAALIGSGWYARGVYEERNALRADTALMRQQAEDYQALASLVEDLAKQGAQAAELIDRATRSLDEEYRAYAKSHPGSPGCVLDADGLRLWRRANTDPTTSPGRGGLDPLRASVRAIERRAARPFGKPSGSGGNPASLPAAAPEPAQLDQRDPRPAVKDVPNG